MIRLVRPQMPDLADVARYYRDSQEAGQFSNFGPCWHRAADRISEMTGMLALPCSSGTMAVALAWAAKSNGEYVPDCSPFTFEGTLAGMRMVEGHVAVDWDGNESVSTYPFGFSVPVGSVEVIDAAGGFCPSIGNVNRQRDAADAVVIAVSFHATKWFPIGEGGCVLFDQRHKEEYERCRRMMNFGMDEHRVVVEQWGTNGKMDELHAASLLAQLDRAETFMRLSQQALEDTYRYGRLPGCKIPLYAQGQPFACAPSMVTVVADRPVELVQFLIEHGVAAQRGYWPPAGVGTERVNHHVYGEDEWKGRIVCLPRDTSDLERDNICSLVESFANG